MFPAGGFLAQSLRAGTDARKPWRGLARDGGYFRGCRRSPIRRPRITTAVISRRRTGSCGTVCGRAGRRRRCARGRCLPLGWKVLAKWLGETRRGRHACCRGRRPWSGVPLTWPAGGAVWRGVSIARWTAAPYALDETQGAPIRPLCFRRQSILASDRERILLSSTRRHRSAARIPRRHAIVRARPNQQAVAGSLAVAAVAINARNDRSSGRQPAKT